MLWHQGFLQPKAHTQGDAPSSPLFSLKDISDILDSFPATDAQSGTQPSFVQSFSDSHLVRCDVAVKRLEKLLEESKSPVKLSNLPTELDVKDVKPILARVDLVYSKDGTYLIPRPLLYQKVASLLDSVRTRFIKLEAYDTDVDSHTLKQQLESNPTRLSTLNIDGTEYITTDDNLEQSKQSLTTAMTRSLESAAPVALKDTYPDVDPTVLAALARELITLKDLAGALCTDHGKCVFTPDSAQKHAEVTKEDTLEDAVKHAHTELEWAPYVRLPPFYKAHSLSVDQQDAMRTELSSSGDVIILGSKLSKSKASKTDDTLSLAISTDRLRPLQEYLKDRLIRLAEKGWQKRQPAEEPAFSEKAFEQVAKDRQLELDVAHLMLHDFERSTPTKIFKTRITALQKETAALFKTNIQTQIVAPIHFYSNGLSFLREKLDAEQHDRVAESVAEYLKEELTITGKNYLRERLAFSKAERTHIDDFLFTLDDKELTMAKIEAAGKHLVLKQSIKPIDPARLPSIHSDLVHMRAARLKEVDDGPQLLRDVVSLLLAVSVSGKKPDTLCLFSCSEDDVWDPVTLLEQMDDKRARRLLNLRPAVEAETVSDATLQELRNIATEAVKDLSYQQS